MFIKPTEEFTLKIAGSKKEVKLTPEQYYLLDRGGETPVPVIRHDALIRIAEEHGFKVDKTELEFGVFHSPTNFCFVHRAYGTMKDGTVVDEVGEANPNNLETTIGSSYPAIMSNKRAQDRLLIRLMGLQGQIYSDVEFGGVVTESTSDEQEITKEEAEKLMVEFGRFRNNPVSLKELQEKYPDDFNWLCYVYKPSPKSSTQMAKLHKAARLLASGTEG